MSETSPVNKIIERCRAGETYHAGFPDGHGVSVRPVSDNLIAITYETVGRTRVEQDVSNERVRRLLHGHTVGFFVHD